MKIKFIAQGIPDAKSVPAGDAISKALQQVDYHSFAAFVAFVSADGIRQIQKEMEDFVAKGGKVRLYIGVDLHGTSKEALELLLSIPGVETYVVYTSNRIVYHPKIYSFEGVKNKMVIVGSSNLTLSGLYQNMEASVCVECANDNEVERELLSDIYDYYNTLLVNDASYCQPLTQEIIDLLCDAHVVLTSKESRAQTNELNKAHSLSAKNKQKLADFFPSIPMKSPKVGSKKALVEEVYLPQGDDNVAYYPQTIQIEHHAMWIETKKMTGGSRNILDLSKKGVRDDVVKPGSVSFFGADKDNADEIIDIDLEYNGIVYRHNTIKFTPGNSNWRLQIKGVSDEGASITYLSNPNLGIPGGLTQKILVFEVTETPHLYRLHIHDEGELEHFKALSSDWANMGNVNGRAYGYLN